MNLELFLFFFKIGAFSFGGGYAMIPLISQELINTKAWMTKTELVDMIAISQMTPGPIAINLATYLGYKKGSILGSLSATVGVILPSFLVMTIFWLLLKKLSNNKYFSYIMEGLRPVVIGLVLSGVIAVFPSSIINIASLLIFLLAFYLIHVKNVSPILTIIAGAIIGVFIS